MIEMSLSYVRIIDLRAEGEGAIREAWLPPPTHTLRELSYSAWSPRGPHDHDQDQQMEGRMDSFKFYTMFFKSPIHPEMKGSEFSKP